PWRLGGVVALVLDVGLMDDAAEGLEPRHVEPVVANHDLERASAVVMAELLATDVEGRRAFGQARRVSDEQELRLGIDEAADQPGARRPVDVAVLAGHPPHASISCSFGMRAAAASASTRCRAAAPDGAAK